MTPKHVFSADSTGQFCVGCGGHRVSEAHWTFPAVHLNGTSRAELVRAYEMAHRAASNALDALAEAAPNMRDYYVQGPHAYRAALAEHSSRLDRLRSVRNELEVIYAHVLDG